MAAGFRIWVLKRLLYEIHFWGSPIKVRRTSTKFYATELFMISCGNIGKDHFSFLATSATTKMTAMVDLKGALTRSAVDSLLQKVSRLYCWVLFALGLLCMPTIVLFWWLTVISIVGVRRIAFAALTTFSFFCERHLFVFRPSQMQQTKLGWIPTRPTRFGRWWWFERLWWRGPGEWRGRWLGGC